MLELLIANKEGPDILAQLYVVIIPAVEDAIALKVKLLFGKTSEVSLPAFNVISPAIGKLLLFPVANRLNAEEKKIMKMKRTKKKNRKMRRMMDMKIMRKIEKENPKKMRQMRRAKKKMRKMIRQKL